MGRGDGEAGAGGADLHLAPQGERIDRAAWRALADEGVETSVAEVRRALRAGALRVDGRRVAPGARVAGGERLSFADFVPRSALRVAPRPDLLATNPVIAVTRDWIALAKAPGLPTLPRPIPGDGALLAAAVAAHPEVAAAGPPLEGGAVHRLDNGTSGVVVFARTKAARARLRAAFAAHAIPKGYEALVRAVGALPTEICAEIETTGGPRVRVHAAATADAPTSRVRVLDRAGPNARVEVTTRWGRRHQVRAHLASAGAPILGDAVYAPPEVAAALDRLGLHAAWIEIDGQRIEVASGWEDRATWGA